MRPWRSRSSSVAVDRGEASLRAVQLVFGRGLPRVAHWLDAEKPFDAPGQPKEPVDPHTWQAEATDGLQPFESRRAALLAGAADIDYCLLTVPDALWTRDPQDQADALRWEVGRLLSRPADDAELAAWPLPAPMNGGTNAMAVAADRSRVLASAEALARHHMECECVEPAAPALVRACRPTARSDQGEIWGVLDLGGTSNRLYLAVDSTPVFARHVRGGGREWTALVAAELHAPPEVAEQYKRRWGIGTESRGCRAIEPHPDRLEEASLPGVLLAILKGMLNEMVADLERAFRFVMEQYPLRQAGSLVLVGGGSRMPGLADWISHQLGVRTAPARADGILGLDAGHPMARPEVFAPMAGCVGLALREREP